MRKKRLALERGELNEQHATAGATEVVTAQPLPDDDRNYYAEAYKVMNMSQCSSYLIPSVLMGKKADGNREGRCLIVSTPTSSRNHMLPDRDSMHGPIGPGSIQLFAAEQKR